jgi:hypothetical protein
MHFNPSIQHRTEHQSGGGEGACDWLGSGQLLLHLANDDPLSWPRRDEG